MKSMKYLQPLLYETFSKRFVKLKLFKLCSATFCELCSQTEMHQLLTFSYTSFCSQTLVVLYWIRQKWCWAAPLRHLTQTLLLSIVFNKILFWDLILNHLRGDTEHKRLQDFSMKCKICIYAFMLFFVNLWNTYIYVLSYDLIWIAITHAQYCYLDR